MCGPRLFPTAHRLTVTHQFLPDVVFHTASPVHGLSDSVYYLVNEQGTRSVISCCRTAFVKNLVYTSSTGVVWTGADFAGVSEDQVPIPKRGYDAYHHTKAVGERLVLEQNGLRDMRVVVLRPCGMTGYRIRLLPYDVADHPFYFQRTR